MQTTGRLSTRGINVLTKHCHKSFPIQRPGTSVAAAARCYASSKEQSKGGQGEPSNHDITEEKASGKDRQQKTDSDTQTPKKKYYSLKNHREGPNPESGEVDTHQNAKDVKAHNKDVESRHGRY